MLGKIIIFMLLSLVLLLVDFKIKRDRQKSLKALLIFLYTFAIFYGGMVTRAIPALFAFHILLILICWGATVLYIIKDRLYLWIYALPLLNIALVFILNFLEGARYN